MFITCPAAGLCVNDLKTEITLRSCFSKGDLLVCSFQESLSVNEGRLVFFTGHKSLFYQYREYPKHS